MQPTPPPRAAPLAPTGTCDGLARLASVLPPPRDHGQVETARTSHAPACTVLHAHRSRPFGSVPPSSSRKWRRRRTRKRATGGTSAIRRQPCMTTSRTCWSGPAAWRSCWWPSCRSWASRRLAWTLDAVSGAPEGDAARAGAAPAWPWPRCKPARAANGALLHSCLHRTSVRPAPAPPPPPFTLHIPTRSLCACIARRHRHSVRAAGAPPRARGGRGHQ